MAESMAANHKTNASFDPWSQTFTLIQPDGTVPAVVPLSEVMTLQHNAVYQGISGGLQTGAALLLLLVLLLVTTKEKRRSWVHIFNVVALVLTILRGVLSFVLLTGPFFNFYRWIFMYYEGAQHAKAVSCAGEVVTFLITVTIEVALVMQVRIVCCNLATLQQLAITMFNSFVAFVVCAVRFSLMVLNIAWVIAGIEKSTEQQFNTVDRLALVANVTLVISIGMSSFIFSAKLAFAIRSRRSLGMTQFGPMQIIFIMGCQTMCTPRKLSKSSQNPSYANFSSVIVTIVAYWGVPHAQITGVPTTIVALSLPLSAMWATANTSNRNLSHDRKKAGHRLPIGASEFSTGKPYGGSYSDTTTSATLVSGDDDKCALNSPARKARFDVDPDLEMQELGRGGVHVERSYSVRTD
jgi:pheromone alpha factor receptor